MTETTGLVEPEPELSTTPPASAPPPPLTGEAEVDDALKALTDLGPDDLPLHGERYEHALTALRDYLDAPLPGMPETSPGERER
ncbi:MAG: hypothetical protein LBM23_05665 [Propionibacteriaceae bacterium]|nr:hypothetical protein [Propionibacteriaceae bacterium]